jgi:carboxylesterase type B
MHFTSLFLHSSNLTHLLQLTPKEPLDVMVNIHGGGFFSGTGASYLWGPQYLLDKDIVLVTFNYRLGVLGQSISFLKEKKKGL